jgi:hypothetical protein
MWWDHAACATCALNSDFFFGQFQLYPLTGPDSAPQPSYPSPIEQDERQDVDGPDQSHSDNGRTGQRNSVSHDDLS